MISRLMTTSLAIVLMAACGDGPGKKNTNQSTPADIVVRATSELSAPAPIISATFVPNSVASWLSHIIMIDKDGKLYRSTTDSQTQLIDSGNYASVIGLARIKQPGVFLAITQSGTLKAFIEADDDGNFKALPISIEDGLRLSEFCGEAQPKDNSVSARDNSGKLLFLKTIISDNASVTLEAGTGSGNTSCPALTYDTGKSLELISGAPHLSADIDGSIKTISITNGLSIAGIDTPGFASVTTANMGSVFRDGVIFVSEKETGRIVLIARDYFVGALNTQDGAP